MSIQKINGYIFNRNRIKQYFKGAAGSAKRSNGYNNNGRCPKNTSYSPTSVIYWALIANTLIINPLVYNSYKKKIDENYAVYRTDEVTQNLFKDLKETFKQTEETSNAFYQLNFFKNTEMPKLEKMGENLYQAVFSINDKKVGMTINTEKLEDKKLSGDLFIKDKHTLEGYNYELNFKDAKDKKFDISLKSQDDSVSITKTVERDYYGDMYLLYGEDKILLNKDNLKKLQEKKELENKRIDLDRGYQESQNTKYLICLILTILKLLTYTPQRRKEY